jgi:hypothetical protein
MSARPRGNPRVEPEEHRRELWDPIEFYVDPRGAARQLAPDKGPRESENSENLSCNDRRPIENSAVISENSSCLYGTTSSISRWMMKDHHSARYSC